jgi:hypothetical protein
MALLGQIKTGNYNLWEPTKSQIAAERRRQDLSF